VLRVKNSRVTDRFLSQIDDEETLDDLSANEVFERCLAAHDVPHEQRAQLRHTYHDVVSSIHEADTQAQ
jgi:exonuclease SbcD